MTPEHQQMLAVLANAGRLGEFSVFPNPPGMDPERNRIRPQLNLDGRPAQVAQLGAIKFADPDWVAKGWAEIVAGPPNDGCQAIPYCPKGWCERQGDCPWSRRTLGAIRDQIEAERRGTPTARSMILDGRESEEQK